MDEDVGGLLPCPFCGRSDLEISTNPMVGFPAVNCKECGAVGPPSRSDRKREAAANWNRKARPDRECRGARPRVGDAVTLVPQPIPGVTARWAGLSGVVEWARDGNVRVDIGDGKHVTCGPCDVVVIASSVYVVTSATADEGDVIEFAGPDLDSAKASAVGHERDIYGWSITEWRECAPVRQWDLDETGWRQRGEP